MKNKEKKTKPKIYNINIYDTNQNHTMILFFHLQGFSTLKHTLAVTVDRSTFIFCPCLTSVTIDIHV